MNQFPSFKSSHIFAWIIIWFATLFTVAIFADKTLNSAPASNYTYVDEFQGAERLISPFVRFDSKHYIHIAEHGYNEGSKLEAFFPLYPLLLKTFSMPFDFFMPSQLALVISSIVINIAAFLAALIILYRLTVLELGNERGWIVLLLILSSPFAFFFAAAYTESLFLALTVGSLYAARRGNWFIASLLAACAGATRLPGILLIPALLTEYAHQHKWRLKNIDIDKNFWFLLIAPLGALFYFWWLIIKGGIGLYTSSYKFGWPERELNLNVLQSIAAPVTGFFNDAGLRMNDIFALLAILAAGSIIIYGHRKLRPMYIVYATLSLLLPLTSTSLDSVPRYYVVIFPLFLLGALLLHSKPTFIAPVILVGSITQGLLITLFTNGYFVG